jgi:hypothetical protein
MIERNYLLLGNIKGEIIQLFLHSISEEEKEEFEKGLISEIQGLPHFIYLNEKTQEFYLYPMPDDDYILYYGIGEDVIESSCYKAINHKQEDEL